MVIQMRLAPQYFRDIGNGDKTFEGRLATVKHANIAVGDVIRFEPNGDPSQWIERVVTSVKRYPSFREMLTGKDRQSKRYLRFIPGATSFSDAVAAYRGFYSEADEQALGTVAIGIGSVWH